MRTDRRRFLQAIGAGATVAAARGAFAVEPETSKKPNIILVMADDQGWGDMAYYGHPVLQTPNFDAMAAETLRFDQFYAAHPVCSPTRGSVMTGRNPNRFGCFSWGHCLRPQEITIGEALQTAGYTTGHFGKWHLGSVRKGSPVNPGAKGFDEWLSAENFYDNDPILSREGDAVQLEGESSIVTMDAALDFARAHADDDDPFLAVVWFGSPHSPHIAAEEDLALYEGHDDYFAHFYGEITGMDRAVGKLREELRNLDIHENTIVWYCSDNGGLRDQGECGGRGHKGEIYEGGLRVPAILEWPARFTDHRITDMPCNTVDIYPTLLDVAGVEMENQPPLDGISLLPLIDGEMDARPEGQGFWYYDAPGIGTPSHEWMTELLEAQKDGREPDEPERLRLDAGEITEQHALGSFPGHSAWTDWPWKLHRIQKDDKPVRWELYNLADDPDEANEVLADEPKRVESLRADHVNWLESVVRSLNGEDY